MSTAIVPLAEVEPTDFNGIQFVIGPARRTPWLDVLPSGSYLCLYYDYTAQAILSKRVDWMGGAWAVGAPVTLVSGITNAGLASFANAQKAVAVYLDGMNGVRFARSVDDGDTFVLDQAEG